MTDEKTLTINVPVLARVEGEGALELRIHNNQVEDLKLRIFEPPRLFEKFLEGRSYREVPDTVARICGICPVAYQMSAVHAIENIFGVDPGPWVRAMRRVIYCGEWIESHSLHIHLLAAPDFLGFGDVTTMAKRYPEEVRRGLRLQSLGNELIRLFGGRSVHPVGVRVGGFYHAPPHEAVDSLLKRLMDALGEAEELVKWTAALPLPDVAQDFNSVALRHDQEYPMNEGRIVSSLGLDIAVDAFEQHFVEHQAPHSTALHCLLDGKPYLVGPLARLNINHDRLTGGILEILAGTGIRFPSRNMFHSVVARAVEIHYALHEAIRVLQAYRRPESASAPLAVKSGVGMACTEAPRGILWHRYELADNGEVTNARIVPPTSQNQARIEEDLCASIYDFGLDQPEERLRLHCETVIRNYDPCISCSTHFLDLTVRRD